MNHPGGAAPAVAVAVKPASFSTVTLRALRAPLEDSASAEVRSVEKALRRLPSAEICACNCRLVRSLRASVGARSAATSWLTMPLTSRLEPIALMASLPGSRLCTATD